MLPKMETSEATDPSTIVFAVSDCGCNSMRKQDEAVGRQMFGYFMPSYFHVSQKLHTLRKPSKWASGGEPQSK